MPQSYQINDIARLPMPQDNVAIAIQRIDAGSVIHDGDRVYKLPTTVMEGHRFAVKPIAAGEPLLSWELPFGIAVADIEIGEYVFNQGVLDALATRKLSFALPSVPNFRDSIEPYVLDEAAFEPADSITLYDTDRTFDGFYRSEARGVGTRNYIVLLGTTSLTGSFVRQLEQRFKGVAEQYANVDGIVAVAHTEGAENPNNTEFVLRTLAGFMVHPNVGAVMAVDYGTEPINNRMLQAYLEKNGYPMPEVAHRFVTLSGGFLSELAKGEKFVREWLPEVNATARSPQSVAHLRIALQCGGSDAFSGISGNPLTGWVAREVIRYGGAANLAETDELIGAEPYILQKVRDWETAQRFLNAIETFKQRVGWHGHTAEGNPTGGNKYRGLYNINLKSIGAARKKNPDVRLDYVLDYAQRMTQPGYYFMDSPGNDIESIAGQVASGSNLITFVTGNGSVTNFPFVPTIKVVTTSKRYQLLQFDMDVNAGAYLDCKPMDEMGAEAFELTLAIASGERSVGENAGHSQVQLWRNWRQTDATHVAELLAKPKPSGMSLPVQRMTALPPAITFTMVEIDRGRSANKVGLIIPTSLCSSEVAKIAAARLNDAQLGSEWGVARFVALTSTEGCGNSSGVSEELYVRTSAGYALHPMAEFTLFLEHGCEKTHNDYMHAYLNAAGIDPGQFGWASIQMDGGIDASLKNVDAWFSEVIATRAAPAQIQGCLADLRLGIAGQEPVTDETASALANVSAWTVSAGGTVVVPQNAAILSNSTYVNTVLGEQRQTPTLAYGETAAEPGFHIMETPTEHWVETLTGLGATGVEAIMATVAERPLQANPLVPLLQIAANGSRLGDSVSDVDLVLDGNAESWAEAILNQIGAVYSGEYQPKLVEFGNIDFQMTRGLLGVTM